MPQAVTEVEVFILEDLARSFDVVGLCIVVKDRFYVLNFKEQ